MEIDLYNSKFCRLCCEISENGQKLYQTDERDVSHLINRYLPLKISNDGRYPRWICPGCYLQVESTVEFFDLIIKGQGTFRSMIEEQSKIESAKNNNLFNNDHVIHSLLGSITKEKRKRGRPTKLVIDKLKEQEHQAAEAAKIEKLKQLEKDSQQLQDENTEGRRKRKIKLPSRFQEVVQGRELERIYVENGVIDKSDNPSDNECNFTNDTDVIDYSEGVIGHIEDADGSLVVDLVFDSSKVGKKFSHSSQKKKFICEICSRSYSQHLRYVSHKMSHHNVQYECTQCMEKFASRRLISEHQEATRHTGEGIIENLETEVDDNHLLNETLPEEFESSNQITLIPTKPKDVLEDVFDEIDNIEEAAKVLYGLQNMDRIESPQSFSIALGPPNRDMNPEISNYANCVNEIAVVGKSNNEKSVHKMKDSCPTSSGDSTVKKRYDCATCNKTFANENLLMVHINLIHESTETNKNEMNEKSSDIPKYPCDKCKRLFKNPSSVLYHKNSEHNHFRFVCLKCGKSFKHKQLLRRHQLVHSQDRPYTCSTCDATFKTKPNLLNHLPIHNPVKNHSCHICKQKFAHKTSLKLHLLWHSGTKPFSCEICGKSFTQNGNLQEHIRIHTNVRPYSCSYCDKKFKTSSQCQIHSKRHNVHLKPFSCHICSKSFLKHDILKTHLRRHNNEKPFKCSFCGKCFSEHWALIKHFRTHTKEKPYKCLLCPKTFADCSNLAKHKKIHQNKSTLSPNSTTDQQGTSEDYMSSTLQNETIHIGESIQDKCDEIQPENLFDQIILADASGNEISDSTVWHLADQNEVDKDNQIFYVTYEDPNFGNKTMKLVNQLNSLPCDQLNTNPEMDFIQENTNEKLDDLQISYEEEDDNGDTSNIQLLSDNAAVVSLDGDNLVVNDDTDLFNISSTGLEIYTSDGKKLRFLQTIQ